MKEKFEDRKLTGNVQIVCKRENAPSVTWSDKKETIVARIISTVDRYRAMGYRLTLRQLHYQFVSQNWIINHIMAYKKLGLILDDCRYAGVVDWNSIVDRGREPHLLWSTDCVKNGLQTFHDDHYRIDRQDEQDVHVEVWTEKDALSEIMERSTEKFHIRLCVNKGYTSSSAVYESYERFCEIIESGRKVVILYFGDHDPSGLDMVRDIRARLTNMFANGDKLGYDVGRDEFEVLLIGLTMAQIKQYKCPTNPAKLTDTRAAQYIKLFGKNCWEVDALPPEALTKILETNIAKHIDWGIYQKQLKREEKDKTQLLKFIKTAK